MPYSEDEHRRIISYEFRRARALLGLSQVQLAEALGASVESVSRWETRKTDPPALKLELLRALVAKRTGAL